LQDGNAIVVANAAAALYEISKEAGKNYIKTNKETIGKLLNALNETNEWGKVYILESIINYKPKENKEAEEIIERISPFLQHANPAVVLGSTKNMLHFLEFIETEENKNILLKKLAAPLVTLLASEPEIQYVALLNIQNILQQIPNVFEKNVKMFFCRFSDPIYVKLAKIDVMICVADTTNVDIIISELHEYCNDIDQDFVRRSIRAIGQVVCKVDRVAKKGIEALREHITHEGGPESALQEAIIAASKILRKYPKKHDTLLKDICAQIKRIDEPESKAAFIWILGEFADKIEGVDKMIQHYVDSFSDETTHVCLQILTAACKMYIKKPDDCEELVMKVLHLASEQSDNPDLRDRGYIYWRMLSTDPSATKEVILIKRPDYTENLSNLMSSEAREIFCDTAGIVKKTGPLLAGEVAELKGDEEEVKDDEEIEEIEKEPEEKDQKPKKEKVKKEKKKKKEPEPEVEKEEEVITTKKPTTDIDDILGLGFSDEPKGMQNAVPDSLVEIFGVSSNNAGIGATSAPNWDDNDIFGGLASTTSAPVSSVSTFVKQKLTEVLTSNTAGQSGLSGLKINGRFYRDASQIKLELEITNTTSSIVSDFEIMFNKNSFGVTPGTINVIPISGGKTFTSTIN